MNLVFMGSSNFAVASLTALLQSKHKISLVVAQPDKPAGRGNKLTPCPVAEFAREKGLPLEQPAKVKKNLELLEQLKQLKPDVIVVVAYGKFLPKEILTLPPRGCVNVHASLLPKYRGAAPINWAILNGEERTGVTTMYMDEEMDEGDILLQCATDIQPHDTAEALHDHLAIIGSELLIKTLDKMQIEELKGILQDDAEATYAPILKKDDGLIDWNLKSAQIYNQIRGLLPWPKAYTFLPDGQKTQLTVFDAAPIEVASNQEPGTVISLDKGITIATGNGQILLLEIQLAGKKRMPTSEFVKGSWLKVGMIFK